MKTNLKIFSILVLVFTIPFFSCKKEGKENFGKSAVSNEENSKSSSVQLGKEIFEGKGNCIACHQINQKIIGPSLQEIAKIYKEKGGNIVSFLKEEAQPIVDPTQYELMKTNFAITEEMSDEELLALEAYIYSTVK